MRENELILFESQDKTVVLPVQMKDESVWLTQAQMAELFSTTKQNVSLHAINCFKEGELDKDSVVKDFLTTASDGKNYKTKYYNLDWGKRIHHRMQGRVFRRNKRIGGVKPTFLQQYITHYRRLNKNG